MRIGELDDSLGKELLARREAMNGDLAKLGARLAEPAHGASRPVGAAADSVRISPEARAAHFPREGAPFPVAPFPSPLELVAVLRLLDAGETEPAAVDSLVRLVRSLAAALPPSPLPGANYPGAAGALVDAILLASTPPPGDVAGLARQLLQAFPPTPLSGLTLAPTPFERAAVAILLAVMAATAGNEHPASPAPSAASASLPPALLALLASPVAEKRRRSGRGRARRDDARGERLPPGLPPDVGPEEQPRPPEPRQ